MFSYVYIRFIPNHHALCGPLHRIGCDHKSESHYNTLHNRATLDSLGASMEVAKYTERLVPSSRIVSVDGVAPALPGANNFIAPSASVIGNVTIGEHSR